MRTSHGTLGIPLSLLILLLCPVLFTSCHENEAHDIVIDRLRIADLETGNEIATPLAGQHVGLEMVVKTPGVTDMVRYVFSQGDSVLSDGRIRGFGDDRFARSGFEIAMPGKGTWVFHVVADPDNLIPEADEDNNEAMLSVTVSE
jgi:hypothetical protein